MVANNSAGKLNKKKKIFSLILCLHLKNNWQHFLFLLIKLYKSQTWVIHAKLQNSSSMNLPINSCLSFFLYTTWSQNHENKSHENRKGCSANGKIPFQANWFFVTKYIGNSIDTSIYQIIIDELAIWMVSPIVKEKWKKKKTKHNCLNEMIEKQQCKLFCSASKIRCESSLFLPSTLMFRSTAHFFLVVW